MPAITIVTGLLLMLVSYYGYFHPEANRAPTALIPAILGGIFLLLGALAFKASFRKHVMHLAAALGLIGFLGAASRLVKPIMALTAEGRPPSYVAMFAQMMMAIICAAFVMLCVMSFITARQARIARENTPPPPPPG